jgi:ABC-type molybdate transport system substrate-binding protein
MSRRVLLTGILLAGTVMARAAQRKPLDLNLKGDRFAPLSAEELTPEQQKMVQDLLAGTRTSLSGPFNVLLRSPEMGNHAQKLGEYVRFQTSVPRRLNEMAILMTARFWSSQYEWYAHERLALEAGLGRATVESIHAGERPSSMLADEKVVYDFCTELRERKRVSDESFEAAVDLLGEKGVVDLMANLAYYDLVSMVLNVDRYPLPEGAALPFPEPEDLIVLSSNATRSVLLALAPEFERTAHARLVFRFAPSEELKARIENGEQFDAVFLTSALADELQALGKVDAGARATIARTGVGVAIRKGATRPNLSTPEALRQTLLDARSIAYVGQGVTAIILRNVFEGFGIAERMREKTIVLAGVTAAEAVASGQAELGFTQVSEILPHPGVELAGPLPEEVQVYTTFDAVVGSSARQPEAARRWLEFLTAPAAISVIRAKGMEPG